MPGRRRPLIGTLQPLQVRILHDGRRRGGPRRAGAERQDGEHGGGGALAAAAQAMDLAVQQARPGGSALLTSASRSCPHESGRGCTCTAQHRDRGGGGALYCGGGHIQPPPGQGCQSTTFGRAALHPSLCCQTRKRRCTSDGSLYASPSADGRTAPSVGSSAPAIQAPRCLHLIPV